MPTISENIQTLNSIFGNIKQSIITKGVNVTGNIYHYPEYILSIGGLTGETASDTVPTGAVEKLNSILTVKNQMYSAITACGVTFQQAPLSGYPAAILQIGASQADHTLILGGPSTVVGESSQYTATYDSTNVTSSATWSIISGGSYATISGGNLTVLSGANESTVVIRVSYGGTIKDKTITVTYQSGTSSSSSTNTNTETDASGNTTTTTTTTTVTTDASGNTSITETTVQTTTNEDGTSTTTESEVVNNQDGSSTSTSTTTNYDENGDVAGSTTNETVNNADGSSTSLTTNYDENGNETGHESTSGDTQGNVNTQTVVKDNQGNDVVTGYNIDTTENPNGGLSVANGVDTGMLVFDGHDWTATLKAKVLFSNVASTSPLVNLSGHDEESGKLNGVCIFMRKVTSGQGSNCYDENGTKQSTTTSNNPSVAWRISPYNNSSVGTYYDFYHQTGTRAFYTNRFVSKSSTLTLVYKIKYTNSNHQIEAEIYKEDGTTIVAKPRGEAGITFTKSLENVTFEIGKWSNIAGNESSLKMEVLDFHVEKTL